MYDFSRIKLICSDIDGTLLPWTGKDLSYTRDVIERLSDAGIEFVLCSGRGAHNMPGELLTARGVRYAIGCNGARITDLRSGEDIYTRLVERELAERLVDFIRPRCAMLCYRDGYHYLDTVAEDLIVDPANASMKKWKATAIRADFKELIAEGRPLEKFGMLTFDPHKRARIYEELLRDPLAGEITITTSAAWNYEFNAKGASKGEAALWLCEHLGFTRENLMTAGDNMNDLSMLKAGGCSVAPANAELPVREQADFVVPPVTENGVENFWVETLLH